MKQNFHYIHCLRVIATLAVVLLHTSTGGVFEEFGQERTFGNLAPMVYKHLQTWSVPAFLLISGALFLSPEKVIDYGALFRKYVKRIFLALLVFGLPMTMGETILAGEFTSCLEVVAISVKEWLLGHTWAHMWYLYLLIGLYLMTPVVKPFFNQASHSEVRTSLAIMFVVCSVLPLLQSFDVENINYLTSISPYLFIYVLGYYLQWRLDCTKVRFNMITSVVMFHISLISIITRVCSGQGNGYGDPACILMAASLFVFFKQMNVTSSLAEKLSPYCFGVYLIHPLFINFSYKVLHLTPLNVLDGISVGATIPLFFFVFAVLSFVCAYFLMKIPFLRKHIL